MKDLPKIHTAVVSIPDAEDPGSIAFAAAHAALEILVKVSADARGSTQLDRVQIVQPTSISGPPDFVDFFGLVPTVGPPKERKYAVMVSCRVVAPKPKETPKTDDGDKP